jgi:hypothetical protein
MFQNPNLMDELLDFGNLKKYKCVTYNPPISSKYTRELKHDILDCIEKDITHCNKLGNILLCGDLMTIRQSRNK